MTLLHHGQTMNQQSLRMADIYPGDAKGLHARAQNAAGQLWPQ